VKPDAAGTFWQCFMATYRFRRSWVASGGGLWVQSGQPGAIDQAITDFAHGHLTGGGPYTTGWKLSAPQGAAVVGYGPHRAASRKLY
jgi:hypothetical protein